MRSLAAILLLALFACGGPSAGSDQAAPSRADLEPTADTEWVTIEGVEFPSAMAEAPSEIVEAYVFAAKHPEVLRYMPCYCGCENPAFAHRNNYDCFVDAIDTTGETPRVDPDPMGFG
ncbi:MAG: PCYCGC domain-containing protein [Gemmatimonadetes bacterium]|nr:PCYCGC domain-containing protein [Gemmatimonadota bacterium]